MMSIRKAMSLNHLNKQQDVVYQNYTYTTFWQNWVAWNRNVFDN